jgi:retron-type reverse transcriptase
MSYFPKSFTLYGNFDLAWVRITRGSNREYKRFFSHLFPSYRIGLKTNLLDLIAEIKAGHYRPSPVTLVYNPKPTGILRPMTFLCLNDQITYQAIVNVIADQFYRALRPLYYVRTFGALYAGRNSPFFYRPWKSCYRNFNASITKAYSLGNEIMADFDLVSFFDLIDHKSLRSVLKHRVKSGELLDLLFSCLGQWTSADATNIKGHGIPQGPEASAFLAAVFLKDFDKGQYRRVTYLRYVDDIRLLGKSSTSVKRALINLDLRSKSLGLVPQAQKIVVREVGDIRTELKSVPSSLDTMRTRRSGKSLTKSSVRRLERILRRSLVGRGNRVEVNDPTKFKFALYRLPPRLRVLKRIRPLFLSRPDLNGVLGYYAGSFVGSRQSAEILHQALKGDPVFDAAAGAYVDALDRCVPAPEPRKYKSLILQLPSRSQEKSLLLDVPSKVYRYKRMDRKSAANLVLSNPSSMQAGLLIQRLALDPRSSMTPLQLALPIQQFARYPDPDLSRFCTYLMLTQLQLFPSKPSAAGRLLLRNLGVNIPISKPSLLLGFFKQYFNLQFNLNWEQVLGKKSHGEAQRRSNIIRGYWGADPSVFITALDSFADLLVQRLSAAHPSLKVAYVSAAGKNKVPDYGAWLNSTALQRVLPTGYPVFKYCHKLRVTADLAHATEKKTGKHTRPITYKESERVVTRMKGALRELLSKFATL